MRTARFANVAIASSLKRLRPNFYHKTYPGRIPIVIQRQQSTSQHARNRFEYGSTRPSARQEDVQWQAEEVAVRAWAVDLLAARPTAALRFLAL